MPALGLGAFEHGSLLVLYGMPVPDIIAAPQQPEEAEELVGSVPYVYLWPATAAPYGVTAPSRATSAYVSRMTAASAGSYRPG